MKIAICINRFPIGGVGMSTYILARGMRAAGHEADILATDWRKGEGYDKARDNGWPVDAICIGERWLRRRLKITLDRLSNYDVVINNHSTETQIVLPALPANIIRLSVIRSTDEEPVRIARYNSQYLDSLVGISPQVLELLERNQVSSLINMIPNAVLVHNDHMPVLSLPLQIIYIGRISERQKNVLIIPDIAKCLLMKGLNFNFTIVGDGPHRLDLEDKIARMALTSVFDFRGAMHYSDARDIVRKSHFSLIPSNYEGFGLVVAEAMADGVIPITSDIPVFRWLLGGDADLLMAPVQDAAAYADRIQALSSAPDRYRQLQKRLKDRQQEFFSPNATVDGYLRLIKALKRSHDPDKFEEVPFHDLPLSKYHERRCTIIWRVLQVLKYDIFHRCLKLAKWEA